MKILVILFFAMLGSGLYAQSVIVNPDGTHSVVVDHGVHKVIVNPPLGEVKSLSWAGWDL